MHTAEAASADGNHKIVLQAVREVTRIVTLMTKIEKSSAPKAATETKAAPAPTTTSANEAHVEWGGTDEQHGSGRAQVFSRSDRRPKN